MIIEENSVKKQNVIVKSKRKYCLFLRLSLYHIYQYKFDYMILKNELS